MSEPERSMASVVEEVERNGNANPRLLDPAATPEKLKNFHYALACPCPTRTMTRETGLALGALATPMFGQPIPISPDSMEVGEARNRCVEVALELGVEWIFFVDYDVAPPPNALVKLLSLNVPIASGVYHSKEVPSYPLIYVKGWEGSFEDYEKGDLIKADGCGMGCTLINMEVFRKIKPPWFKTVPGYSEKNPSVVLPNMTEDIFFCNKAKDAGYDIIVDTGVQALHVDWVHAVIYHRVDDPNNPKKGTPGWSYNNTSTGSLVTETVAPADHPSVKWSDTKPPPKPKSVKVDSVDLGSGGHVAEGYVGVDLYENHPNVIRGDISDLGWLRKKHGLMKRIRSSHSLEHFSHREISRIFRDWVNTLKPGGEMTVIVPDLSYHIKRILEMEKKGEDQHPDVDYWIATLFGWQVGKGQDHRTGFTQNRLKQLALSSGLVDVKVKTHMNPGDGGTIAENRELVLTGKRGK
jgi:predicted SAM-dependent methyltransferase